MQRATAALEKAFQSTEFPLLAERHNSASATLVDSRVETLLRLSLAAQRVLSHCHARVAVPRLSCDRLRALPLDRD
jgi:hypothetical protein